MTQPTLHPTCEPIAFLLGTWSGQGRVEYPTISRFEYLEEVTFWHSGKPFLAYQQKTWHPSEGFPMHAEMGYWRPQPGGRIEMVMAHPTGVAEVSEGTVRDGVIDLRSTHCVETSTAKDVTALARLIRVDGDTMTYEMQMAAVGQPLLPHLSATLKRVS